VGAAGAGDAAGSIGDGKYGSTGCRSPWGPTIVTLILPSATATFRSAGGGGMSWTGTATG
jgi:hypothetical protein